MCCAERAATATVRVVSVAAVACVAWLGALLADTMFPLPAQGQWAQPGTSARPRLLSSVAVSPVAPSSTVYLALAGGDVSPTQAVVAQPFDAAVLRRLRCAVSVAPGAGESVTLTVQTGVCGTALADSLVTCVIADTATTAADLTHAVILAAGECAAVKATYSAGAAASLPRTQLAAY